jgi:hypothetical protein
MKKLIALFALTLIISFIAFSVPQTRNFVAGLLPLNVKLALRKTVFIIPAMREDLRIQAQQLAQQETTITEQSKRLQELDQRQFFANLSNGAHQSWPNLALVYSQSPNSLALDLSTQTIRASDGQKYHLSQYKLPFLPTGLQYGYKPLFYVDSNQSNLFLITGDGVVFTTNINQDYTLSILVADLSESSLEFSEFFTVPEAVSVRDPFNAHQIGGRIVAFGNDRLLVSTGDFRKYDKAQSDTSLLGKIFAIDIHSKRVELLSKGHRNVQGLAYAADGNAIFSTEHGPNGGDEINLNLIKDNPDIENFGWPMASYGLHYDSRFHPEAPLHKSHKEHGYREPLKQFTPSVGISEIIKVPSTFSNNFTNDYFASTMGLNAAVAIQSLHHFRMNSAYNKITYESVIKIGERIRDLEVLDDKRLVMALEGNGTPAIGILQANTN